MKLPKAFTVLLLVLIVSPVSAIAHTTWTVDQGGGGDFLTIQEGIDAAADGDTVLVADGTYTGAGNKNLDFGGKAITVKSDNGPDNCILDGEGDGRAFHFHNGEGPDSIVHGFTIQNFNPVGIFIDQSDPVIDNCVITGNGFQPGYTSGAGGISINGHPSWHANPLIKNCIIRQNFGCTVGSGINIYECSPTIQNCDISFNEAQWGGAGVSMYTGHPIVTNCTIVGNTSTHAEAHSGGIYIDWYWDDDVGAYITNSIIRDNSPPNVFIHRGTAEITHCDIGGGWPGEGNIDEDPLFVSGPLGDRYLDQTGPCIGTGSDTAQALGLDTATTSTNHIGDAGIVDMGFHYPVLSRINLVPHESNPILSTAPSLKWIADGHTVNGFIVGFYLLGFNPSWSTGFSTWSIAHSLILQENWDVPDALWNLIPSQSIIMCWVVGLDVHRSPIAVVNSDEIWLFYKP